MTPAEEKRFRRLWASGRSGAKIADDFGVYGSTISKWQKRLGLPQRRVNKRPSFFLKAAELSQPKGKKHELWVMLARRYRPVVTCKSGFRVGPNSVFVTTAQAEEIAAGKYLNQVAA